MVFDRAHDVEHADHDGSANAADVYRYFSMILDAMPNPQAHSVATCTKPNAWLRPRFSPLCRPASAASKGPWEAWADSRPTSWTTGPVRGTGEYYYKDPALRGADLPS